LAGGAVAGREEAEEEVDALFARLVFAGLAGRGTVSVMLAVLGREAEEAEEAEETGAASGGSAAPSVVAVAWAARGMMDFLRLGFEDRPRRAAPPDDCLLLGWVPPPPLG